MDEADRASPEIERSTAEALRNCRAEIPPGKAGDCDLCGEWTQRLIGGACAPCRDKYKLP